MSSFISQKLFLIFLVAVCTFVVFDINKHGNFKGSKTGTFLRERGLLKYVELPFIRFRSFCQRLYWRTKQSMPVYLSMAQEKIISTLLIIRNILTSVILHLWDSSKQVYKYVVDKRSLLIKWVNHYAPGLQDSVYQFVTQAWLLTSEYVRLLLKYLSLAIQWLKDNILVGNLSPENLKKYAGDTFWIAWSYTKWAVQLLHEKLATITASV